MWEIWIHILLIILMPFVFAIGLLRGAKSKWEWWTNLAVTLTIAGWAFVIGRWDMAGYYLRGLLFMTALGIVFVAWRRMRAARHRLPWGKVTSLSVILNIALTLVFAAQVGIGIVGLVKKEDGIELAFPLQDGVYYVGHGGSTVFVNYHAAYPPQAYALDIVALNPFGYRAAGAYPSDLDRYVIFGKPLYSPCTGEIIAARDGLPDLTPPARDPERPEGNFVAIDCDGVDVILAHMQENSVMVSVGDFVTAGQPIGRVGNSGNTSEPHLHIHAERLADPAGNGDEWIGVPIHFDGRFLGRNSIVRAD